MCVKNYVKTSGMKCKFIKENLSTEIILCKISKNFVDFLKISTFFLKNLVLKNNLFRNFRFKFRNKNLLQYYKS